MIKSFNQYLNESWVLKNHETKKDIMTIDSAGDGDISYDFSSTPDLQKSNFVNCIIHDSNFNGCDLTGSTFFGSSIAKTTFDESIISNVNFSVVEFEDISMKGVKIINTERNKKSEGCNFTSSWIRNSDFSGVEFGHVTFNYCVVSSVNFSGCNFLKCEMSKANFKNCDFTNTKFNEQDVKNITMKNFPTFTNCDFTGSNLFDIVDLSKIDVDSLKGCIGLPRKFQASVYGRTAFGI